MRKRRETLWPSLLWIPDFRLRVSSSAEVRVSGPASQAHIKPADSNA